MNSLNQASSSDCQVPPADSSTDEPPPPYPGPPSDPLPSYNEAVTTTPSHHLPSYRNRTTRHRHTYWCMRIDPRTNILSRYQTTVFDESFTPLIVPPPGFFYQLPTIPITAIGSISLITPRPPTIHTPLLSVNPAPPPPVPDSELTSDECHRRRVWRLMHLIPEFERAVREGLEVAKRAMRSQATN
ncbi:hypothetical protein C0991_008812 [Blastosporella zonata]|nr:hypothetical protein C0991_008812 [Blastosporella zonata]